MSKKIRRIFNWTLISIFSFGIVFIILKRNHEKIDNEKVIINSSIYYNFNLIIILNLRSIGKLEMQ